MEVRTRLEAMPSHARQSVYEEFGLPPRFPRIPFDEICKLLRDHQEPQVFLRGVGEGEADITVRLPMASSVVPRKMRKSYSKHGVTLSQAFEDVLWQKLEAEKSTIWAEMTGLVMKVYRQAWRQWFRLQYLGHFHPAAESMFKKFTQELDSVNEVTRRGRQPSVQAELTSVRKRYDALLPKCKLIHQASKRAAIAALTENNVELARKEIRIAIWKRVRRSVHGMPGDGYIFDGTAFGRIRRGTAKLHDPETWKPHQLAIALVSLERSQAYQTIEKKIVPTKRNSKSL